MCQRSSSCWSISVLTRCEKCTGRSCTGWNVVLPKSLWSVISIFCLRILMQVNGSSKLTTGLNQTRTSPWEFTQHGCAVDSLHDAQNSNHRSQSQSSIWAGMPPGRQFELTLVKDYLCLSPVAMLPVSNVAFLWLILHPSNCLIIEFVCFFVWNAYKESRLINENWSRLQIDLDAPD